MLIFLSNNEMKTINFTKAKIISQLQFSISYNLQE